MPLSLKRMLLESFPIIFTLLKKIFASFASDYCKSERTFSTRKVLKTYLRNVYGQVRLSGLALKSLFRSHDISIDTIIDEFSIKITTFVILLCCFLKIHLLVLLRYLSQFVLVFVCFST